jgi:hypothetical protein
MASLQLTSAKATDRARPVTSQRFGALLTNAARGVCPATGGLAPTRRNRFCGLPYAPARQSFAVVGPEAIDRVSTRWGPPL